ncbi:MAG: hypothetical protein U1E02_10165, partial [Hydrogenophaga sp.]|nr:hypothetical protein [Hydrogenophaga sp.]
MYNFFSKIASFFDFYFEIIVLVAASFYTESALVKKYLGIAGYGKHLSFWLISQKGFLSMKISLFFLVHVSFFLGVLYGVPIVASAEQLTDVVQNEGDVLVRQPETKKNDDAVVALELSRVAASEKNGAEAL